MKSFVHMPIFVKGFRERKVCQGLRVERWRRKERRLGCVAVPTSRERQTLLKSGPLKSDVGLG